ncbi:DUF1488 domain-containing protein [Ensifer sp. HO-A22]|uniref:DUF1488 domain-containing protein n=1 Tax=Ensifer oleiphilus TaxID=2742698 RepID=A0A7Y6QBZ4_9HYPH|nr:DUF1488 domain-containing protein [Ensifer oleiphilus]NVD42834.1 DUF1488 domain-containing protein [Ensifer oleiphilus]
MTLSFPNNARSYDETHRRVRFAGYDGMFEVKCFVTLDVLARGLSLITPGEREYLEAFDKMRPIIVDAATRAYNSNPQGAIVLGVSNFR